MEKRKYVTAEEIYKYQINKMTDQINDAEFLGRVYALMKNYMKRTGQEGQYND
jgi:hypothetical protein